MKSILTSWCNSIHFFKMYLAQLSPIYHLGRRKVSFGQFSTMKFCLLQNNLFGKTNFFLLQPRPYGTTKFNTVQQNSFLYIQSDSNFVKKKLFDTTQAFKLKGEDEKI